MIRQKYKANAPWKTSLQAPPSSSGRKRPTSCFTLAPLPGIFPWIVSHSQDEDQDTEHQETACSAIQLWSTAPALTLERSWLQGPALKGGPAPRKLSKAGVGTKK